MSTPVPGPGGVSALEYALSYVRRGWAVAPVNVNYLPTGKKKVDFLVPWGSAATTDEEQVRAWYAEHPYAGVAIATKASKLVGVDLDVNGEEDGLAAWLELCGEHGGGEVPETYTVRTPTGGLHLLFEDPDNRAVNSSRALAPGIDVRGGGSSQGGVLFAPPTSTSKGRYTVEVDVPPAPLPEWAWKLIEKPKTAVQPLPRGVGERDSLFDGPDYGTEPADENEVLARIARIADEIGSISGSGGNDQAARLAFMAGQYAGAGQISVQRVTDLLRAPILAWERASGWESTWHKTIEAQVREGAKRPRPWAAAQRTAEQAEKAEKVEKHNEVVVRKALDFGDATIAEVVCEEVLLQRFVRTKGLGWLKWTGKHWKACDDGAPVEATRRFVKARLIAAIRKDGIGSSDAKGWATYNSAGKIGAVVGLAGNMDGVLRDAADFDQWPDLLNTPAGVLNLGTLAVLPHEPELLLTKITKGNYVPGTESKAFATLLTAVPEDALEWLRAHAGQGVSGRPKPRQPAVLLTGGGRNGKTLLCETALEALGGIDGTGYAAQIPNELLLLGRVAGGPSPEKLALRGARLAYIEETPEGRYLDTNALKKIVGTGVLTARAMYKDLVTFRMTHVLFVNTNFPPRVTETDTATWDRLTALRFPYRFRKANDDLGAELPEDRPGDSDLAGALQDQEALDACLTWAVEGYRAGAPESVVRPASVAASISEWRREGDMTLRFVEDVFEYSDDSWVTTAGLYSALQRWCEANGQQKPPPLNMFMSRLRSHTGLGRQIVLRQVRSGQGGLSLPDNAIWVIDGAAARRPETAWTQAVVGLSWVKRETDTSKSV